MPLYFVNTDAKSNSGQSYHDEWLGRGVAVTSGPRKFRDKLAKIGRGDTVLMYVNGIGVVAAGVPLDDEVADVLEEAVVSPREQIEYHRRVDWQVDLRSVPISPATVRELCGQTPLQTIQRVRKGERQLWRSVESSSNGSPPESESTADFTEYVLRAERLRARGRIRRPAGVLKPAVVQGTTALFCRDPTVRAWAFQRADRCCELCRTLAPFFTEHEAPYLESHHIVMLSEGGPDTPDNTAALCPNCHRNLHYGAERLNLRERLRELILRKEAAHESKGNR